MDPRVLEPSNEAQQAMSRFQMPKGVEASVWAAEPLLANPVSFCFDEKGRCYVVETFRLGHGVTDDHNHMYWLDDDMASRTVADRVAMYKKHAKDRFIATYETAHERVKLVWDGKGEGKADQAIVFADGFHHAAAGAGPSASAAPTTRARTGWSSAPSRRTWTHARRRRPGLDARRGGAAGRPA